MYVILMSILKTFMHRSLTSSGLIIYGLCYTEWDPIYAEHKDPEHWVYLKAMMTAQVYKTMPFS